MTDETTLPPNSLHRNNMPWTRDEEDTLIKLYESSHSYKKIGKVLHRSPGACCAKLNELRKYQCVETPQKTVISAEKRKQQEDAAARARAGKAAKHEKHKTGGLVPTEPVKDKPKPETVRVVEPPRSELRTLVYGVVIGQISLAAAIAFFMATVKYFG